MRSDLQNARFLGVLLILCLLSAVSAAPAGGQADCVDVENSSEGCSDSGGSHTCCVWAQVYICSTSQYCDISSCVTEGSNSLTIHIETNCY